MMPSHFNKCNLDIFTRFSRSLLSKLKHMGEDTPHDEYAPILEVMCLWGKVNDVLELVSDWLMSGLHGDHPPEAKVMDIAWV